ncbi:uncharacterized protein AB675_4510 [Cyphellophora attinorum]|uniref:Uncharacterized protein n=1 Tax=Cyphellophora attinorum TaxID=1664694 RepID=A0A0N1HNK3_9EURO|nr:uncharacterized protein AB675_4510 [Phialophora attinorum]KPI39127.1 hypothetical protein AB675_4510 [Phialophora attinorum]
MSASLLTLPAEIRQMILKFALTGEHHCQPDLALHGKDGDLLLSWKKVPSSEYDLLGCQNPLLPLLLACKVINQETKYLEHGYVFELPDSSLHRFSRKLRRYPDWNSSIFLKLRRIRSSYYTSGIEAVCVGRGGLYQDRGLQGLWDAPMSGLAKGVDAEVKLLEVDGSPLRDPYAGRGSSSYVKKKYTVEVQFTELLPPRPCPSRDLPPRTLPPSFSHRDTCHRDISDRDNLCSLN